jgi:hypothetical protein
LNEFDERGKWGEERFSVDGRVAGRVEAVGDPDADLSPEG